MPRVLFRFWDSRRVRVGEDSFRITFVFFGGLDQVDFETVREHQAVRFFVY